MKTILLFLFCIPVIIYAQSTKISSIDVDHFWEAYDSLAKSKDSVSTIQRLYLDRGTKSLTDFVQMRNYSAVEFVKIIHRYPDFWNTLPKSTQRIKSSESQVNQMLRHFSELYPDFKSPKIYFLIGALRSGGTAKRNAVYIGSEIACVDSNTDTHELKGWHKTVLQAPQDIVELVAHEATHSQQPKGFGFAKGMISNRLLTLCLQEGSADFIAKLVTNQAINKPQYSYGFANEASLWKEFKSQMNGTDLLRWLYNGNNSKDRPADLGYFIGYRICESYYDHAVDKNKAVREIIRIKKFRKFLRNSQYSDKFK